LFKPIYWRSFYGITTNSKSFSLGQTVHHGQRRHTLHAGDVFDALERHARGDWAKSAPRTPPKMNAPLRKAALLSAYSDRNGLKFWIITEWDRSATTVLLPEDY